MCTEGGEIAEPEDGGVRPRDGWNPGCHIPAARPGAWTSYFMPTASGICMATTGLRGPQHYRRVSSTVRTRLSAAAAIGLALAGTLLGCAPVPGPSDAHRQSEGMASPPAIGSTRTVSASRPPAIGKPYPFKLLIHCGVPIVEFGGRAWQPIAPVPAYPGPRQVNGTATYTGYVAGTMTLVNARTLRFVADDSAVASPFSVVYEPLTSRITRSPCSLPGRLVRHELGLRSPHPSLAAGLRGSGTRTGTITG